MRTLIAPTAALLWLAGCAPAVEDLAACYQCGEGTAVSGAACVGARPPCGGGTRAQDGVCVVDPSTCGAGSALVGTRCDVTPAACAGGLVFSGGQCRVPAAVPAVKPFLDKTGAVQLGRARAFTTTGSATLVQLRHLKTELSNTDASAWVVGAAPMIGTGLALHFSGALVIPYGVSEAATSVTDDTLADGGCKPGVDPASPEGLHVALYRWSGGKSEPVVCARTGSVRVARSTYAVELTLNVLLGDGNVYGLSTSVPIAN